MKSIVQWLTLTWLGKLINVLDTFTSVSITLIFVYFLRSSRTGFRQTETMINRLIAWAVNTGLIASKISVLTLIFVRSVLKLQGDKDANLDASRLSSSQITSYIYFSTASGANVCQFTRLGMNKKANSIHSLLQLPTCDVCSAASYL